MVFAKKKVFIAGGSHAEIPLVNTAKKMGFYVITSGNDSEGKAHRYSDASIICDYSNKHLLKEAFKFSGADYLIPGANDFSILSCAAIAEEFNLIGYDSTSTNQTLHHKDKWRSFCLANHIKTPLSFTIRRGQSISELEFKYPVLVKPIDMSGGKGISKAYSYSQLNTCIENALSVTRERNLVIEEFIEGSNHGASILLRNKRVSFIFLDDEYYYLNPFLVAGATSMTLCSESTKNKIIRQCEMIADLLKLKNGLLHVQFIIGADDIPIIIEICRRLPGDLYPKLVEYSTGYPYCEEIIRSYIGESANADNINKLDLNITRHCVMANKNGSLKSINITTDSKSMLLEWFQLKDFGETVSSYLSEKIGIAFLKHAKSTRRGYPTEVQYKITTNLNSN